MRNGFTLIELLVVIAIIAILAAMLFPVFNRAREKARFTRDLSNLRQVMMAITMYADDHHGYYPFGDSAGFDDPEAIRNQLRSYVRNDEVMKDRFGNGLTYFSRYTYRIGTPIDHDGRYLHRDSYQGFFRGEDEAYDMDAMHPDNSDNLWIDVPNLRVVEFRKIQAQLEAGLD